MTAENIFKIFIIVMCLILLATILLGLQVLPNNLFEKRYGSKREIHFIDPEKENNAVDISTALPNLGVSPRIIALSVKDGSLYYEGKTLSFHGVVESKFTSASIKIDTGLEDVTFIIRQDQKRIDIDYRYTQGEIYRFNVIISKIEWDNKYWIWANMIELKSK